MQGKKINERGMSAVEIILGYSCNANCIFCPTDSEKRRDNLDTDSLKEKILASRKYNTREIIFNGGEPTIRKDLLELISFSKKAGYEDITVQSNGFLFSNLEYVRELAKAGLSRFSVSIHSHKPSVQDSLTRVPGSFNLTVKGIKNIIKLGLDVELVCVVMKQNVNFLKEYISFFYQLGIKRYKFYFITPEGKVIDNFDTLIPKISLAAYKLRECYKSFKNKGVKQFYCLFIPYCFFKDYDEIVFNPKIEKYVLYDTTREMFLENSSFEHGTKPDKCRPCKLFEKCFGINKNYLKLFEESEIKPIKD